MHAVSATVAAPSGGTPLSGEETASGFHLWRRSETRAPTGAIAFGASGWERKPEAPKAIAPVGARVSLRRHKWKPDAVSSPLKGVPPDGAATVA
ncbi:MAG: hypothetical protein AAF907_12605, partial [Planctomycetota bacterium]